MSNINWKVRLKNKQFWVSMIPMIALLLMQCADLFGIEMDLTDTADKLVVIASMVFSILGLLGVVTDPTTEGVGDSEQAMTYLEPRK